MDRAGGYLAYLALREDARAYDDVVLAMRAERDAAAERERNDRHPNAVPEELEPVASFPAVS